MKMTSIRLDDEIAELIELLATRKGVNPADIMRAAIRDLISAEALNDTEGEFREAYEQARSRAFAKSERSVLDRFGSLPA